MNAMVARMVAARARVEQGVTSNPSARAEYRAVLLELGQFLRACGEGDLAYPLEFRAMAFRPDRSDA